MIEFKIEPYYTLFMDEEETYITSSSKHAKGRKLSIRKDKWGYLEVKLRDRNVKIHSLIAEEFIGKRPNGYCVNHKDGNKLNNKPSNLEYLTISDNTLHAISLGLHICSRPEEMPTYIDGRTRDRRKYQRDWAKQKRINKKINEKAIS
jgi:hypothetical protein